MVMVRGWRPSQGPGGLVPAWTVTVMESVRVGSLALVAVTVMVAVPGATALTVAVSPEPLTVATLVLLELHAKE